MIILFRLASIPRAFDAVLNNLTCQKLRARTIHFAYRYRLKWIRIRGFASSLIALRFIVKLVKFNRD